MNEFMVFMSEVLNAAREDGLEMKSLTLICCVIVQWSWIQVCLSLQEQCSVFSRRLNMNVVLPLMVRLLI